MDLDRLVFMFWSTCDWETTTFWFLLFWIFLLVMRWWRRLTCLIWRGENEITPRWWRRQPLYVSWESYIQFKIINKSWGKCSVSSICCFFPCIVFFMVKISALLKGTLMVCFFEKWNQNVYLIQTWVCFCRPIWMKVTSQTTLKLGQKKLEMIYSTQQGWFSSISFIH